MKSITVFTLIPICMVVATITIMFSAFSQREFTVEQMQNNGYQCVRGREPYGPPHARDWCYVCTKDDDTIAVMVWGHEKDNNIARSCKIYNN